MEKNLSKVIYNIRPELLQPSLGLPAISPRAFPPKVKSTLSPELRKRLAELQKYERFAHKKTQQKIQRISKVEQRLNIAKKKTELQQQLPYLQERYKQWRVLPPTIHPSRTFELTPRPPQILTEETKFPHPYFFAELGAPLGRLEETRRFIFDRLPPDIKADINKLPKAIQSFAYDRIMNVHGLAEKMTPEGLVRTPAFRLYNWEEEVRVPLRKLLQDYLYLDNLASQELKPYILHFADEWKDSENRNVIVNAIQRVVYKPIKFMQRNVQIPWFFGARPIDLALSPTFYISSVVLGGMLPYGVAGLTKALTTTTGGRALMAGINAVAKKPIIRSAVMTLQKSANALNRLTQRQVETGVNRATLEKIVSLSQNTLSNLGFDKKLLRSALRTSKGASIPITYSVAKRTPFQMVAPTLRKYLPTLGKPILKRVPETIKRTPIQKAYNLWQGKVAVERMAKSARLKTATVEDVIMGDLLFRKTKPSEIYLVFGKDAKGIIATRYNAGEGLSKGAITLPYGSLNSYYRGGRWWTKQVTNVLARREVTLPTTEKFGDIIITKRLGKRIDKLNAKGAFGYEISSADARKLLLGGLAKTLKKRALPTTLTLDELQNLDAMLTAISKYNKVIDKSVADKILTPELGNFMRKQSFYTQCRLLREEGKGILGAIYGVLQPADVHLSRAGAMVIRNEIERGQVSRLLWQIEMKHRLEKIVWPLFKKSGIKNWDYKVWRYFAGELTKAERLALLQNSSFAKGIEEISEINELVRGLLNEGLQSSGAQVWVKGKPAFLLQIKKKNLYVYHNFDEAARQMLKAKELTKADRTLLRIGIIKPKILRVPTIQKLKGKQVGLERSIVSSLTKEVAIAGKFGFLQPALVRSRIMQGAFPPGTDKYIDAYLKVGILKFPTVLEHTMRNFNEGFWEVFGAMKAPWWSKGISASQMVTKLTYWYTMWGNLRVAAKNTTQGLLTYSLFGTKDTIRGYIDFLIAITNPKSLQHRLLMQAPVTKGRMAMEQVNWLQLSPIYKIGVTPFKWGDMTNVGSAYFSASYSKGGLIPLAMNKSVAEFCSLSARLCQWSYRFWDMPRFMWYPALAPLGVLQTWWINYFTVFWPEILTRAFYGRSYAIPNYVCSNVERMALGRYIASSAAFYGAAAKMGYSMKSILPWGIIPTGGAPWLELYENTMGFVFNTAAGNTYEAENAWQNLQRLGRTAAHGGIAGESWARLYAGYKGRQVSATGEERWPLYSKVTKGKLVAYATPKEHWMKLIGAPMRLEKERKANEDWRRATERKRKVRGQLWEAISIGQPGEAGKIFKMEKEKAGEYGLEPFTREQIQAGMREVVKGKRIDRFFRNLLSEPENTLMRIIAENGELRREFIYMVQSTLNRGQFALPEMDKIKKVYLYALQVEKGDKSWQKKLEFLQELSPPIHAPVGR